MTKRKLLARSIVLAPLFSALAAKVGTAAEPAPPEGTPSAGDVKPPPNVGALRCPGGYKFMSPGGPGSRGCWRPLTEDDCVRNYVRQGVHRALLMSDSDTATPERDQCKIVYNTGQETFAAVPCNKPGDIPSAPMVIKGTDLCPGDTSRPRPKPPT
jgi:hypothetical protein